MVEKGPDSYGGIMGLTINSDVTFEAIEYSEVSITFATIEGVDVKVSDLSDPFNEVELESGAKVFKYAKVLPYIKNNTDKPVILTITMEGQSMGLTIPAGEEFESKIGFIEFDSDLLVEEYVEYNASIDLGEYSLTPYIMALTDADEPVYINNGDKIAKNTLVMVMIMNQDDKTLNIEIKVGTTIIYSGELDEQFMLDDAITINGDLSIIVSEA